MITNNVLQRVFHIQFEKLSGTCFIIDIDNLQYFVTAKHVVKGLKTGDIVNLFIQQKWHPVSVNLIGHSTEADVSVFSIEDVFTRFPLPAGGKGLILGQDVYFLGFPYGLRSEVGALNHNIPLPLIKKAIVSAVHFDNSSLHLLDGHNNSGFSGGPVVFKPNNQRDFAVFAIISAYRYEIVNVELNQSTTPLEIKTNTGIIITYDISCALALIKTNPNGSVIRS